MRIPDEITDSVVFLAVKDYENEPEQCGGTAVMVIEPSRVLGRTWQYLVTAGHCVDEMKHHAHSYIRANTQEGGTILIEIDDLDQWKYASDYPATDMAVLPIAPESLKLAGVSRKCLALPEWRTEKKVGLGDELYAVGLFTRRTGKQQNIPIVRTGTIAAMPDELVPDAKTGVPYHAYLAEIRSIGGLSGAPVLIDLPPGRVSDGTVQGDERWVYLLGLIRGHWKKGAYELADFAKSEGDTLNTGIATVTPIDHVVPIIDNPEWKTMREETEKRT